jgi:hypothetical protein
MNISLNYPNNNFDLCSLPFDLLPLPFDLCSLHFDLLVTLSEVEGHYSLFTIHSFLPLP